jgi:hypothetical protein
MKEQQGLRAAELRSNRQLKSSKIKEQQNKRSAELKSRRLKEQQNLKSSSN